jgi:hypothetical protein
MLEKEANKSRAQLQFLHWADAVTRGALEAPNDVFQWQQLLRHTWQFLRRLNNKHQDRPGPICISFSMQFKSLFFQKKKTLGQAR